MFGRGGRGGGFVPKKRNNGNQIGINKRQQKEVNELVAKKLEQLEECQRITNLEFENKALRAELEHQKLLIAHNALQTKMEELSLKAAKCVSREQMELELKETNKKLEQQLVELGNNAKDALQKTIAVQLEHHKRLNFLNAEKTKMEKIQPKRQRIIDTLTKKLKEAAKCVEERERAEQMELELKETNRKFEQKLEEWGKNYEDVQEKALQAKIAVIESDFAALNGKIERFEAAKCVESERVEQMGVELLEGMVIKFEQKTEEYKNTVQQLKELNHNLLDALQKMVDQLRKH